MKQKNISFLLLVFILITSISYAQTENIPYLKKQGTAVQLIVDGKPILMLAGELGNSSASSKDYMEPIWDKLVKTHLNTLLAPVYWELIEPEEGMTDFSSVDYLIESAKEHNIKLVFLWFGTWKNSMTCYAPLWVKKDQQRFPRARKSDGTPLEIVTPFSKEAMEADARIYSKLMKHIKEKDSDHSTVVMMQVENEIAMIDEARDYSKLADDKFNANVPEELTTYLEQNKDFLVPELHEVWQENGFKTFGSWEELFGKDLYTDEIFMAWYYAEYTNYVASAGKAIYPLPAYVNAALNAPGKKPGEYPSAGPLPHLFDIWKAAAPDIDFLAPDIYFNTFKEWTGKFKRHDNPLFIPEVGNTQSITNAFFAFGEYDAMGYSPFSIESMENPGNNRITMAYDVLHQLSPLILEKQGKGEMAGALLDSSSQADTIRLGDYIFYVKHDYSWPYSERMEGGIPRFGGMIIELSPDEFIIAGSGIVVTFASQKEGCVAGIGTIEEGEFVDGKWKPGRRMNGDQDHQGRHLNLPGTVYSIQKIKLYEYK